MSDDENKVIDPNDINNTENINNAQTPGAETPAPQAAPVAGQQVAGEQIPQQPPVQQPQMQAEPVQQQAAVPTEPVVQQPVTETAPEAAPQPQAEVVAEVATNETIPQSAAPQEITAEQTIQEDVPVAEGLTATSEVKIEEIVETMEDTEEDGDFDDNLDVDLGEQVIAASAKRSGLMRFVADRNTLLAVGAFAAIGASVFGYLYYSSMQNDMLAQPARVKMIRPPVNIARGTVPGGKSPLAVMKKQGELGKNQGKGEMISPNIVSEILNVDEQTIEKNKVDIKNSILSDVIPEDKKAKEAKLEMEKELRLANARALLEQHKLKLEEAEIEALALEMAKADAEAVEDSASIEEMLQEDAMIEAAFAPEKEKQTKAEKEELKKKRLAEAQKILDDIAKKEQKIAKKTEDENKELVVVDGKGKSVYTKKEAPEVYKGPSAIDLEAVADAELAIIQNSTVLDTLPPPSEIPLDPREKVIPDELRSMQGHSVDDILAQKANVRPLPNQYIVVKKEREAEDMEAQLTGALSALGQNRYVAALELFNNMYREFPDNPQVLMGRAVSMQKLGQHSSALSAYEDVLRVDPRNLEALTNMLGILKEQDTNTALFNLKQLRELYPYNAEITAQLGMIYGMQGDFANSVKYLDMADALKPNDMNILFNKAVAYDKMGKSREAADIYRKIVYRASYDSVERTFPIEAVKRRLASIK